MFPFVDNTTELLVYYLSDKFPINSNDPQLPCDANNNPLVDPIRGDYFFISLNDDTTGADEYLSNCLNMYPKHEQYTFLNKFETSKVGGVLTTTIEGEGTQDTLYAHVCGIGMSNADIYCT